MSGRRRMRGLGLFDVRIKGRGRGEGGGAVIHTRCERNQSAYIALLHLVR